MSRHEAAPPSFEWRIPLSRWSVWDSRKVAPGTAHELGFIDAMQRRRLSPLARAVLHVANQCAGHLPSVQFVYASRHGELQRTMELLANLATGEPLSPTTFGLSVLNASPGLYSIIRQDTAPATAISAGENTLASGLQEALLRAGQGMPVLFVYADAPLPSPLQETEASPSDLIALSLLIEHDAPSILSMQQIAAAARLTPSPQVSLLADLLESGGSREWHGQDRGWRWSLQ